MFLVLLFTLFSFFFLFFLASEMQAAEKFYYFVMYVFLVSFVFSFFCFIICVFVACSFLPKKKIIRIQNLKMVQNIVERKNDERLRISIWMSFWWKGFGLKNFGNEITKLIRWCLEYYSLEVDFVKNCCSNISVLLVRCCWSMWQLPKISMVHLNLSA